MTARDLIIQTPNCLSCEYSALRYYKENGLLFSSCILSGGQNRCCRPESYHGALLMCHCECNHYKEQLGNKFAKMVCQLSSAIFEYNGYPQ